MDVAASFQFMIDALEPAFFASRTFIAPDWRGFGLSTRSDGAAVDHYVHADYLGDLDFLIAHFTDPSSSQSPAPSPNPQQNTHAATAKVDLVAHSMGGNIAMIYAGVQPEKIRKLVNLEGFGLPRTQAEQAPARYAEWLGQLRQLHRGEIQLKPYASIAAVAARLQKTNPRLPHDKAAWLAQHWARETSLGQWQILGDAAHKVINPQLYRADEAQAIHARIQAPVLSVVAQDGEMEAFWQGRYTLAEYHERMRVVPQLSHASVADAGHMLHHDQAEVVAQLVHDFLR